MQEQAISSPHSVSSLNEPLNMVKPTASVRILSVFVTIRGHIKLFQVVTNVNILKVIIAGSAEGNAIRQKTPKEPQPSIRAASSNSVVILEKYCFIIKTPNPPKIPGIINA